MAEANRNWNPMHVPAYNRTSLSWMWNHYHVHELCEERLRRSIQRKSVLVSYMANPIYLVYP